VRYRIVFANGIVGQSQIAPIELESSDHLGVAARTSDVARQIRERVVDVLTAAPASGAETARPVIAANTQIEVMLNAGEGAAYYGGNSLGRFSVVAIP